MRSLLAAAAVLLAVSGAARAQEPVASSAVPIPLAAQEMTPPKIIPATVDWAGVRRELIQLATKGSSGEPPSGDQSTDIGDILLAKVNAAAGTLYKDIQKSAVPVLLPVDAAGLLHSTATTPPPPGGDAALFKPHFFMAGAAGYDVVFTLEGSVAGEIPNFARKEDPVILMSGFAMTYDLPPPVADPVKPSPDLQNLIPGIRRRWLESYSRYSFERYGVTYTVSMLCTDGRARGRWVACQDADRVMVRFIKSLQLAGGTPTAIPSTSPQTVERPTTPSLEFTYAPPGKLLPNTGFKGHDGRSDYTVYARIRFPLAQAPAYANSQAFMNWGNCDFTGRVGFKPVKGAPYRCKVNDKPLVFDESAPENRAYPWRDNFCEHRRFFVGQCPGGEGHQGQDIRPVTCKLRNEGADRCMPFLDDVVAVRDGMILRVPRRESLYLLVNAPGEHIRFRYLHLAPAMLDTGGMTSGRVVHEGEVIGKAGNFDRIPNGTSYHVHFEVQVPSRDGWVFVSPYATLITAYERLIGGRGREVPDPPPAAPPPAPTVSGEPAPAIAATAPPASGLAPKADIKAAGKTEAKPARIEAETKPADRAAERHKEAVSRLLATSRKQLQHAKKEKAESERSAKNNVPHRSSGAASARETKREKAASRHAKRDSGTPVIVAPEHAAHVSDRNGSGNRKPRRAGNRAGADAGLRKVGDAVPAASAGAGDIRNNIQ
jgi:hypothetical protein